MRPWAGVENFVDAALVVFGGDFKPSDCDSMERFTDPNNVEKQLFQYDVRTIGGGGKKHLSCLHLVPSIEPP